MQAQLAFQGQKGTQAEQHQAPDTDGVHPLDSISLVYARMHPQLEAAQ